MILIKKDRSVQIPTAERRIGFENDHLVESRLFCVADAALTAFTFKLDLENTADIVSLTPVSLDKSGVDLPTDAILLRWDISQEALGQDGVLCAQLRAFDAANNRVWHSEKMEFTVGDSVHATQESSDQATITEFEQIEKRVDTALTSMEEIYTDTSHKYEEIVQMGADYTEAMEKVDTLASQTASHYAAANNPHAVTAAQVGAYTKSETDALCKEAVGNMSQKLTQKADTSTVSALEETVDGIEASVAAHKNGRDNPHRVTAFQTGAYTKSEVDEKLLGKLSEYKLPSGTVAFDSSVRYIYASDGTDTVMLKTVGVEGEPDFGTVVTYGDGGLIMVGGIDGIMGYAATTDYVDKAIGDIDTALDGILTIQNNLIGGATT